MKQAHHVLLPALGKFTSVEAECALKAKQFKFRRERYERWFEEQMKPPAAHAGSSVVSITRRRA